MSLLIILLASIIVSACTPKNSPSINPIPTRIPETQNLNQLDWTSYQNTSFGLSLNYPSTWTIDPKNDQLTLTGPNSTITITKSSKLPTNFKPNFSLALGVPAQLKTNLVTAIMAKNSYSITLNNPRQNQLDNLIFGKLIQTIDLTVNPNSFTCLSQFPASSQPTADYFIWQNFHCQP